jgi:hypothetical protein
MKFPNNLNSILLCPSNIIVSISYHRVVVIELNNNDVPSIYMISWYCQVEFDNHEAMMHNPITQVVIILK